MWTRSQATGRSLRRARYESRVWGGIRSRIGSPARPTAGAGTGQGVVAVTELRLGVVDVLVVRLTDDGWRVLLLRRAADVRCPGAWEMVHGTIEAGERPGDAALRELREETGLVAERLYNVTVHGFHLHQNDTVQVAVAFCAFVAVGNGPADDAGVRRGSEHDAHEWLSVPAAAERLFWPQERRVLHDAHALLRDGHAGPAEDVLRVV